MRKLAGNTVEGIVVDTMDGKRWAEEEHPHTIGVADLRAVSTDRSPLYSGGRRKKNIPLLNKIGTLL